MLNGKGLAWTQVGYYTILLLWVHGSQQYIHDSLPLTFCDENATIVKCYANYMFTFNDNVLIMKHKKFPSLYSSLWLNVFLFSCSTNCFHVPQTELFALHKREMCHDFCTGQGCEPVGVKVQSAAVTIGESRRRMLKQRVY